ncbi:MAG: hypothetical protein QM652_03410 [Legionella sp.]|uniref:hypothetical protein n=1 Tax=Legionella sp. TaxID=459 RepID=UPI0039E726C2
MNKKKILVLGPISAQAEDLTLIASILSFLDENYVLDYIDSLSIMENLPNTEYYTLWKQKLNPYFHEYDAFFGFSFGGVILQQCFSLFAARPKSIILFSTPTFADASLTSKLSKVIHLCQKEQLEEALNALYQPVFSPYEMPKIAYNIINRPLAYQRLIFGLTRVLQTDSSAIVTASPVHYIHLIGEYSDLVNTNNVISSKDGHLIIVPKASMRVLQDNPSYCQKVILEALNHEF